MEHRIKKEESDLFGVAIEDKQAALRKQFIEPPFSILDTQTESWQSRKKLWMQLGIKSELGRDVKVHADFASEKYGRTEKNKMPKESIFDPALCEIVYNWFCPEGGSVLDSFAGGSVRGITCNFLKRKYTGIDIRPEQIISNREQALKILSPDNQPEWIIGDSNERLKEIKQEFDLFFTCPPYADLEVYSDLPGDISNMKYPEFLELYRQIIYKSCLLVKSGGFAVIVIGEVRNKKTGEFYNFLGDTIQAFKDCGMMYWNEIVLRNMIGSAMLRANNTFQRGGRKVVKIHQNVLVFKKPDDFFL